MREQLPAPDFDGSRYERPNDPWVCGRLCTGQPCREGPSPGGQCRVRAECQPRLETSPGEEKGRWICTRARGGPCAEGPRPDGSCCHNLPPCAPRRSLRSLRGRITAAASALLLGALLLALGGAGRWRFINPGPVAHVHDSRAFIELAHARLQTTDTCVGCHRAADGGPGVWLQNAALAGASQTPLTDFARRPPGPRAMTALDRHACAVCHTEHGFHQPNIVESASCSACHVQHDGVRMAAPDDARCADCHGSPVVMAESSARGHGLPSARFDPPVPPGVNLFTAVRPPGGRTNVFRAFWDGHPEFGLLAAGRRETNSLRFNHALHLGDTVRDAGRPLVCADCHRPDAAGAHFARLSFEQDCRRCHALQFDPEQPALTLPHGDVAAARALLRGLPLAYAELARQRGLTRREEVDAFAQTNLARMRATFGGGEALERLVFFTGDAKRTGNNATPAARAFYAGCAFCHTVGSDPNLAAVIAPVNIPDRWFRAARFSHAAHTAQDCQSCHKVSESHATADISLPPQMSCVACHSPAGGAPAGCATCHTYHLGRRP